MRWLSLFLSAFLGDDGAAWDMCTVFGLSARIYCARSSFFSEFGGACAPARPSCAFSVSERALRAQCAHIVYDTHTHTHFCGLDSPSQPLLHYIIRPHITPARRGCAEGLRPVQVQRRAQRREVGVRALGERLALQRRRLRQHVPRAQRAHGRQRPQRHRRDVLLLVLVGAQKAEKRICRVILFTSGPPHVGPVCTAQNRFC